MGFVSFTNITLVIFSIYLFLTAKTFYDLFNPAPCPTSNPGQCLYSMPNWQSDFTLALCIQKKASSTQIECSQLIELSEFNLNETFFKYVNVDIPQQTRNNGTLIAYVLLTDKSNLKNNITNISKSKKSVNQVFKEIKLSKYKVNGTKYVNLLEKSYKAANQETSEIPQMHKNSQDKPITHLLTNLNLNTLNSHINFDRYQVPSEIYEDLRLTDKSEYLPIFQIDTLSIKDELYMPLNESQVQYTLRLEHSPVSIGKFRLLKQLEASIQTMKELGFNEKQLTELTSLFTDTSLYLVTISCLVAIFHVLFEFLAFKNDINFWRKRKTTVGLSVKSIAWRTIGQIVILAYLFQEETSLIILGPSIISIFIEIWKIFKAFKVKLDFSTSIMPKINYGEYSKQEIESNSYDAIAMKKLSYLLYPICIIGAIYSLVYNEHKSWLAWLVNSLANGVYAFGFLFMTPQLFLNYKLKSVAHLPWKAFMYKAFNTFIDDIFAFIIKMPTTHRIACLRDDVVFIVYLYQRWLYPIDKTRTNEFGEAFENSKED